MLLLACFLWLGPACPLIQLWTTGLGMALPTVNWALLHPSLTPLSLSRPHGRGALSVEVPCSEQTPMSVNLTENKPANLFYPPLSLLTPFWAPLKPQRTLYGQGAPGRLCQEFTLRLLPPASPPWRTSSGEQQAAFGEGREV